VTLNSTFVFVDTCLQKRISTHTFQNKNRTLFWSVKKTDKGVLILTDALLFFATPTASIPKMVSGSNTITSIRVNGANRVCIREKTVTSKDPCKPEVLSGELSFIMDPAFDNDRGGVFIGTVYIDGIVQSNSSVRVGRVTNVCTINEVHFDPYARKMKLQRSPAGFATKHDLSEYQFEVGSLHATGGSELDVEGNIFSTNLSVHSSEQATVTCRGEPFKFVKCDASG